MYIYLCYLWILNKIIKKINNNNNNNNNDNNNNNNNNFNNNNNLWLLRVNKLILTLHIACRNVYRTVYPPLFESISSTIWWSVRFVQIYISWSEINWNSASACGRYKKRRPRNLQINRCHDCNALIILSSPVGNLT